MERQVKPLSQQVFTTMSTSKKQRIQAKKKVRYNLGGDGFGQSAEQKRRRFETNRTHRAPAPLKLTPLKTENDV